MIEVPKQEESNNEDVLATVAKKLCEITEKHAEIFRAGYDAGLLGTKTLSLFETCRAEALKEAKAYTDERLDYLVKGKDADGILNTIAEISKALNDDANAFATLVEKIAEAKQDAISESEQYAYGLFGGHIHNEYALLGHIHDEYADAVHEHDEFDTINSHTYAIADLNEKTSIIRGFSGEVEATELNGGIATITVDGIVLAVGAIAVEQENYRECEHEMECSIIFPKVENGTAKPKTTITFRSEETTKTTKFTYSGRVIG